MAGSACRISSCNAIGGQSTHSGPCTVLQLGIDSCFSTLSKFRPRADRIAGTCDRYPASQSRRRLSICERHALLAGSRNLLPARFDCLQQFALVRMSIPKNGHNQYRHNFSVRVQGIEAFIRADLIEHAFANSHIERAKTGTVATLMRHVSEPFQGPPPVLCGGLMSRGMKDVVHSFPATLLHSRRLRYQ